MSAKRRIRVAVIGVGNCCSALVQGLEFYKYSNKESLPGLMSEKIGDYAVSDIEIVHAIDIDKRKVGVDLSDAIFREPNCTARVNYPEPSGVVVQMGKVLDSISQEIDKSTTKMAPIVADQEEPNEKVLIDKLSESKADMMLNFLPVGSQKATEFYAECALETNMAFINCIPVFIANEPKWREKFAKKNLPLLGDDIKSQCGATAVHSALMRVLQERGCRADTSYQINVGGNSDFRNMLDRHRTTSKRISKTYAIKEASGFSIGDEQLHIGPADFIPFQKDRKIAFINISGTYFNGTPFQIDVKLSVEDSPNAAAVAVDCIRHAKCQLDKNTGGAISEVCRKYFKKFNNAA